MLTQETQNAPSVFLLVVTVTLCVAGIRHNPQLLSSRASSIVLPPHAGWDELVLCSVDEESWPVIPVQALDGACCGVVNSRVQAGNGEHARNKWPAWQVVHTACLI